MKTKLLYVISMFTLILFSGCDNDNGDDRIWDIYPVVYTVQIMDHNGNDLLNPATPNSLDYTTIKAIYKDNDYPCKEEDYGTTKAYMPRFYGLIRSKSQKEGPYLLKFGELEGSKSYKDEAITLVYEDGSSDVISFNRDFRWDKKGNPDVKEQWFLNGKQVERGTITITK